MFWIRYWPEADILGANKVNSWGKIKGTSLQLNFMNFSQFQRKEVEETIIFKKITQKSTHRCVNLTWLLDSLDSANFKKWRQRLPWFVKKTKALQLINDQIGILHSAEWIWAKPEDEEEVSPEHVICAKELGDVQLSSTFWANSSVKWPPFQREVHSNVIISQQTW